MSERKKIPDSIKVHVESLHKEVGASFKEGNFKNALEGIEEIWRLLPAPQFNWDYYPEAISRAAIKVCLGLRDFSKARHWLENLRSAYEDTQKEDPSCRFIEAEICFAEGQLDEAYLLFDGLYRDYKKRPFEGSDPKYLEFYLEKKKSTTGKIGR